jgi:Ca2+/H+ antiporter, TMEM165/GDT1 family
LRPFTIVLAISLSLGWAGATGAAIAALATLGVMTIATGGALHLGFQLTWIQLAIGVFRLLFGVGKSRRTPGRTEGLAR